MNVKQISVFVENKAGKLAELTQLLAQNDVNIRALSIADTSEFGILRLIVSDYQKAADVLTESGWISTVTDVLAACIGDTPGSLSKVLTVLAEKDISIEYMYGFVARHNNGACMVFRVEDIENTKALLVDNQIKIVDAQELLNL